MFIFKCPICNEQLNREDRIYKCCNNHCFDIAKQGYVNLLLSQKSSKKRHGDDTLMVNSRRDFLDKGFYENLRNELVGTVKEYANESSFIADLGCGECYYTDTIQIETNCNNICGIDISKQALISASKRNKTISLAVASTTDLPIMDNYCDIVISVFAPVNTEEIFRVLKSNGVWIKVFPLERHLFGLKEVIYDKPYLNEVDTSVPNGFSLIDSKQLKYYIEINNNNDILNLFRMTPYYYKTSQNDQNKLNNIDYLKTELEFGIYIYKK